MVKLRSNVVVQAKVCTNESAPNLSTHTVAHESPAAHPRSSIVSVASDEGEMAAAGSQTSHSSTSQNGHVRDDRRSADPTTPPSASDDQVKVTQAPPALRPGDEHSGSVKSASSSVLQSVLSSSAPGGQPRVATRSIMTHMMKPRVSEVKPRGFLDTDTCRAWAELHGS